MERHRRWHHRGYLGLGPRPGGGTQSLAWGCPGRGTWQSYPKWGGRPTGFATPAWQGHCTTHGLSRRRRMPAEIAVWWPYRPESRTQTGRRGHAGGTRAGPGHLSTKPLRFP